MPNPILTRAIDTLASRIDLTADQTAEVLREIMGGEVSEIQIAGFLIALRTKGETVSELAGLARTMRELAEHVPTDRDDLLDTAGTGGGTSSFNVSTTAALIAAGAGCAVAKHGNRSATSRSGSADLLEALGARIDLRPAAVASCISEAGFGFMFAPAHHQATRFVVQNDAGCAIIGCRGDPGKQPMRHGADECSPFIEDVRQHAREARGAHPGAGPVGVVEADEKSCHSANFASRGFLPMGTHLSLANLTKAAGSPPQRRGLNPPPA